MYNEKAFRAAVEMMDEIKKITSTDHFPTEETFETLQWRLVIDGKFKGHPISFISGFRATTELARCHHMIIAHLMTEADVTVTVVVPTEEVQ